MMRISLKRPLIWGWMAGSLGVGAIAPLLLAQTIPTPEPGNPLQIVVNGNGDTVQPDDRLTLREAIQLANGSISMAQLSPVEQRQVTGGDGSGVRIAFNLADGETTIQLDRPLPDLTRPGLILDGTSQPGYDPAKTQTREIPVPIPVVAITPAPGVEVLRGLTVTASNVTIRGLSLHGFSQGHDRTAPTPPADIFISHSLPPPNTINQQPPDQVFPFGDRDIPPQNVVVEDNWLGLPPSGELGDLPRSAFGVLIYNAQGTIVRRNRIANHDGSGIITSVRAIDSQIFENLIIGNGVAGMPDAIRLEGVITRSQIAGNLICGNDGSGIYLFKPDGQIEIRENQIIFNGRRLRRAAVYLMGSDHRVTDNEIRHQTGAGVVVAAYPDSDRNLIRGNRFSDLEGLSIDLNSQQNVGVQEFQGGDGPNPPRNSFFRRIETGNGAINRPEFLSREFYVRDGQVNIDGQADPGSQIDLYRVMPDQYAANRVPLSVALFGPLGEPIATTTADAEGRFGFTLQNLPGMDTPDGVKLSAIATDPDYGTSEPAENTVVRPLNAANPKVVVPGTSNAVQSRNLAQQLSPPQCTTPPEPPVPAPPPEPPPAKIRLRVPQRVHFALDGSDLSAASRRQLDLVIEVLQQYSTIVIDLIGHTDPRASDAYNQALGLRRARSVRDYLLRRGIDPARLTLRSQGEQQRRTTGNTRLDFARDRRVEIIFRDVRGVEIEFVDQETDLQIEGR